MKRILMTLGIVLCLALAAWAGVVEDANAAEEASNLDEFIRFCTKTIDSGKLSQKELLDIYITRGVAWSKKGQYDQAIADFNSAIQLNPKLAIAYQNRGAAWIRKGQYDQAIADLNSAIQLNPKLAIAYENRGAAWHMKGQDDKAIADFNIALELFPAISTFKFRAIAEVAKGQYDQAIADFNIVLETHKNDADIYIARGGAYKQKGDFVRARADYQKALQIDSNNEKARSNLAAIEGK